MFPAIKKKFSLIWNPFIDLKVRIAELDHLTIRLDGGVAAAHCHGEGWCFSQEAGHLLPKCLGRRILLSCHGSRSLIGGKGAVGERRDDSMPGCAGPCQFNQFQAAEDIHLVKQNHRRQLRKLDRLHYSTV